MEFNLPLYVEDIRKILPHRYPFLLVDRVTDIEPGVSVKGYKMVTTNEPHFTGHYPDFNIMPGVLIVEAMAQLGGVAILSQSDFEGKRPLLSGIDGARFRGQVRPGDKLELELTIDRLKGRIGKGKGTAHVDGKLVAEAEILFAIVDAE
ncbi:3-hydroxyacyl-ACP dehydratase FabZ [Alicyclobacillus fastidiosus]|uniref:3-hydroxyacyl-[acyl-carrier-protein] dehydratase FabZ n=1 Tax=Alicyclobacillus fastidiosus TaxID=392011 RepID=A0ABV5AG39_9BACL|nr:3-hydroxyacyl-ACP dehydratase FabZ [Alicyclobacillus fastidiosus]WEH09582.1 3-hydroxyacyl-ACP dehydratase FabZ [Alicyclobacillus fastidiosus]